MDEISEPATSSHSLKKKKGGGGEGEKGKGKEGKFLHFLAFIPFTIYL